MVDVLAAHSSAEDGPDASMYISPRSILNADREWREIKRAAMSAQQAYWQEKLKILRFGVRRETADLLMRTDPSLSSQAAFSEAEELMRNLDS